MGEILLQNNSFPADAGQQMNRSDIILSSYANILKRLDGPIILDSVILGMELSGFDGYPLRDVMIRTAKDIVK